MRFRYSLRLNLRTRSKLFVTLFIVLTFLYIRVDNKSESTITEYSKNESDNRESEKVNTVSVVHTVKVSQLFNQTRSKLISNIVKKKDWHDYVMMEYDNQHLLTSDEGKRDTDKLLEPVKSEMKLKLMMKYRINTVLSDRLPLNRSLPDVRHEACKKKLYMESLPTASVIIAFHNEYLSTLLRAAHSVINRSPKELLKEIFLVDDASTEDMLKQKLDDYVKENLPDVKVVRLARRGGVVGARLAGAKLATADVLVFLDSHVEVNVNWLPPLLEPIAIKYRTAVEPLVDSIDSNYMKYRKTDEGARGAFDWTMKYVRNPITMKDTEIIPDPIDTPVMKGMYAISRKFFWELGGYDTGLEIWGGEQYELSFKIWMCGGRALQAPCSRVGHVYRDVNGIPKEYLGQSFIMKNYRRVAEVWADDFAEILYKRNPAFKMIDPGDVSKQKALRLKLDCKSFEWYLTKVAFDLVERNFQNEKPFAEGWIRPITKPKMCVDAVHGDEHDRIALTGCVEHFDQLWQYTSMKEIRLKWKERNLCWDVTKDFFNGTIYLYCCHGFRGNQEWIYHEDTKLIQHKSGSCLDYNLKSLELYVTYCNKTSETQKWIFNKEVDLERFNWEFETDTEA